MLFILHVEVRIAQPSLLRESCIHGDEGTMAGWDMVCSSNLLKNGVPFVKI